MKQCLVWCWLPLWGCLCLAYRMDSHRKAGTQANVIQASDLTALREVVMSMKSEIVAELHKAPPSTALTDVRQLTGQRLAHLPKTISVNLNGTDGRLAPKCSAKVPLLKRDVHKHSLAQRERHNVSQHRTK